MNDTNKESSGKEGTPSKSGSSPGRGIPKANESEVLSDVRTEFAQNSTESEVRTRFPVTVKYRTAKAKIYGRAKGYDYYRVAYRVAGRRVIRSFGTYSDALAHAEAKAKEIHQGATAAALSPAQVAEFMNIQATLKEYLIESGREIRPLSAVAGYVEAQRMLRGHSLTTAIKTFMATAATITKRTIHEAVEEYVALRQKETIPPAPGKRSKISKAHWDNIQRWLREFDRTFLNYSVTEISDVQLAAYFEDEARAELSPKARNDRRATLRAWWDWCVGKHYLSKTHELKDASCMKDEPVQIEDVDYYRVDELRKMLDGSEGAIQAFIALQAFTGARTAELCRLTWQDVWGRKGGIEFSQRITKTKKRRMIQMDPTLAKWLVPFRECKGLVVPWSTQDLHEQLVLLRSELGIPSRRNGLRRGYATHAFALLEDKEVVASRCGTSAEMLDEHYKGLATKEEAAEWFNIVPAALTAKVIIPMPASA